MTNDVTISTIPQWHTFMRPVLQALEDNAVVAKRVMEQRAIGYAGLSEAQAAERLDSGQLRSLNRIGWATSALRRAKALSSPSKGTFLISDSSRQLLSNHTEAISVADLEWIPAYTEYVPVRKATSPAAPGTGSTTLDDQTPQDLIQAGLDSIEDDVKSKLLERLRGGDPLFFEQVVRTILVKMGYGTEGELSRLPGSGDGGLDGKIDRDELGLSQIYVQAKRYAEENVVGRPAIQGFVGALATRGANVGVFFTTSKFSGEAMDAAERVPQDIALVDGLKLTELMIKHRVGVQVARRVDIVKIDEDFFSED
jgi:restriction system protein